MLVGPCSVIKFELTSFELKSLRSFEVDCHFSFLILTRSGLLPKGGFASDKLQTQNVFSFPKDTSNFQTFFNNLSLSNVLHYSPQLSFLHGRDTLLSCLLFQFLILVCYCVLQVWACGCGPVCVWLCYYEKQCYFALSYPLH